VRSQVKFFFFFFTGPSGIPEHRQRQLDCGEETACRRCHSKQAQENGHRKEEENTRQSATMKGKRRGRHLNSGKKIASISWGSHQVICKFL
jgi:hypothetical protein